MLVPGILATQWLPVGLPTFALDGSVQLNAQTSRAVSWGPFTRAIGNPSGGNARLHIERVSWAGANLVEARLNNVIGTLVKSQTNGADNAGVAIFAWSDGSLPASAGSYNLVVNFGEATLGTVGHVAGQPFVGAQQSGWVSASGVATGTSSVACSTQVDPVSASAWVLDGLRTDDNDVVSAKSPASKTTQLGVNGTGGFTNTFAFGSVTGLTAPFTSSWTISAPGGGAPNSLQLETAAIVVEPAS